MDLDLLRGADPKSIDTGQVFPGKPALSLTHRKGKKHLWQQAKKNSGSRPLNVCAPSARVVNAGT
jgi:hypothetical protein